MITKVERGQTFSFIKGIFQNPITNMIYNGVRDIAQRWFHHFNIALKILASEIKQEKDTKALEKQT